MGGEEGDLVQTRRTFAGVGTRESRVLSNYVHYFSFFINSCIGFLSLYNYFPLFYVDIVIFQFLYYFHLVHGEN